MRQIVGLFFLFEGLNYHNFVSVEWCLENFELLKYEHIVYHYKACDLEIPLI